MIFAVGSVVKDSQVGGDGFLFDKLQKSLKIRARHGDVNVVVPWDETLVTHGSKEGAICYTIT
jgi:hypothetical protein